MIELLRREFIVDLPREKAWEHLSQVEQWPSWAGHIKQVKVEPATGLGPQSTGVIRLSNGIRSRFEMAEFNPHRNWKWVGNFLWLTIHYDHRFESVERQRTRLTWVVLGEGLGVSVFGRLFAKVYAKNLDRAIPALVEEMNAGNGNPD